MKTRMFYKILTLSCVALFVASPVFAQTTTPQNQQNERPASQSGLPACTEWYTFGQTPVSLTAEKPSITAGETVTFTGTITNDGDRPLVDATIHAKIFRDRSSGVRDVNGPDVVDFFAAVTDVTLGAGEKQDIRISWDIPTEAQAGRYTLATYVTASDRFDYQGLTFADDSVGNIANFVVTGEDAGGVIFDKSSVTVAGGPFYFATFPPTVLATTSVVVAADVVNSTAGTFRGTVEWKLYVWDGIGEERLLKETTDELTLPSESKAAVTYTVEDTDHSVYYLVGRVREGDVSRSLIGVRFLRNGVDTPRLSVAASDYPLTGEKNKLFVCAHDSGNRVAEEVTLTLTATPHGVRGLFGTIASATYEGALGTTPRALVTEAKSASSAFTLTATLSQNGNVIDTVDVPYSCKDLGASCSLIDTWYPLYALGALLLIIAFFIVRMIRRRKPKMVQSL